LFGIEKKHLGGYFFFCGYYYYPLLLTDPRNCSIEIDVALEDATTLVFQTKVDLVGLAYKEYIYWWISMEP
jgi:hypothetical protein